MVFEKGQKCTNCGKPDEFSDETLCGKCIAKWKDALILKERNRILKLINEYDDLYGLTEKDRLLYMINQDVFVGEGER